MSEVEALCENCAGTDEDLVPVWPVSEGGDATELWCADCRDRYPHEPADDTEESPEG